uniref:Interferon n=1 Tax=Cyprinidae sp. EPC TaxID=604164 RepID=C7C1L5_9TELE|nr:interferon [Cyprinidae sp. EPC]
MKTQMWTYMFVLFFTLQSKCSACEWLGQYRRISRDSLTLLKEMGGNYPDIRVPFPGQLYNWIDNAKVEDQVKFLVLTLEHIIRIMDAREDMNAAQWNLKTVDRFLSNLNRQSSELKECVARYHHPSHKESYEIKIKRHFRKLKKILKKKEYSAQAWELIRRAVRHHLQRMDIIASIANRR